MEHASSSDGVRIHFEVVGDSNRKPLLVVPGGPCRDPEYLGDLGGLSSSRQLIVMHLRGTSSTGGLSRGWWTDGQDLIAVADAVGLERLDVLAHSAGTRMALAASLQFPHRISSLTLVTPPATWLTGAVWDGEEIALLREDAEVSDAMASMQQEPGTEEDFQLALLREAPAGYAKWSDSENEHSGRGSMTLEGAQAWFRDIPANVVQQILQATLPPTHVVAGSQDILSGVKPVKEYADVLGAFLTMIPNSGHYPWVDNPSAFLAAVMQ